MEIVCAWCDKSIGEKEPLTDKSVTHGICEECLIKNFPDLAEKAGKIMEGEPRYPGVKKKGNPVPTGTCYEEAWRFLIKQEEGELVHGTVLSLGKRIGHAWVELPTGYIWEPMTGGYFKHGDFQTAALPMEEHRYNVEEAAIMLARVGKHGPWTDEERARWLHKKEGNPSRVHFDRASIDSAIAAARRLKSDRNLYIFATHLGYTIDRRPPPGMQQYVIVHPDGTTEMIKPGVGGNPMSEELDLARTLAIIDSRPKGRIIESKLREEFGDAVIDALRQGSYVVSGSAGYNPPLLVSLKGRELIQGGNPIPYVRRQGEWIYVRVGDTEMRGRPIPSGIDFEQVSPTAKRDEIQKAVDTIAGMLKKGSITKEYWQMTLAEYKKTLIKPGDRVAWGNHYVYVKQALEEGKPVPPEVLANYPDLAARYGPGEIRLSGRMVEIPLIPPEEEKEGNPMEVRLWTGVRIPVSNREEAVTVIKRELEGWRQEGDRIVWYKKEETDPLPTIAYVMDSLGELTDASAVIVETRKAPGAIQLPVEIKFPSGHIRGSTVISEGELTQKPCSDLLTEMIISESLEHELTHHGPVTIRELSTGKQIPVEQLLHSLDRVTYEFLVRGCGNNLDNVATSLATQAIKEAEKEVLGDTRKVS